MALQGADVSASVVARFWSHVQRAEGCWLWTGPRSRNGYGRAAAGHRGATMQASWLSVLIDGRAAPTGSQVVMHSCDNPPCVRPSHLVVAEQADNLADMKAKGRQPDHRAYALRGELSPCAKLTATRAAEIRQRHAEGIGQWPLAREFGVSRSLIQLVVQGKKWLVAA